ncbi:hypothetical protein ACE3MZ_15155 [Paenibacillus sp. WLX1005]|uniref:hypothetical protein n=1 Tax=Paenibacillus sp. WLX1005 TaxID=3243766 RepID=UPI003983E6E5
MYSKEIKETRQHVKINNDHSASPQNSNNFDKGIFSHDIAKWHSVIGNQKVYNRFIKSPLQQSLVHSQSMQRFKLVDSMTIHREKEKHKEKIIKGEKLLDYLNVAMREERESTHPLHNFDQTVESLKEREKDSKQNFNAGAVTLTAGKNNYVSFANENTKNNIESEANVSSSSSGADYGEIRKLIDSFISPDIEGAEKNARELASKVRTAIAETNQQDLTNQDTRETNKMDSLAGLIAGIMGVAETIRNPLAIPMLLMFLDLIEYGQTDWKEGLGPKDEDRNSLSLEQKISYFGLETDNKDENVEDEKQKNNKKKKSGKEKKQNTANKAVLEQRLKDFADKYFPNPESEVRKRILSEGNFKSISALGGSIPMVGAGSAKQVEGNDYQRLVTLKEHSMLVRWVEQKYKNLSIRMQDYANYQQRDEAEEKPADAKGLLLTEEEQADWSNIMSNKEDEVFTKWFKQLLTLNKKTNDDL